MSKDKIEVNMNIYDIPILVEQLEKANKETERLNNIINELEKYMNENYIYDDVGMKIFDASVLQDKLQELKGSNNNEQ